MSDWDPEHLEPGDKVQIFAEKKEGAKVWIAPMGTSFPTDFNDSGDPVTITEDGVVEWHRFGGSSAT